LQVFNSRLFHPKTETITMFKPIKTTVAGLVAGVSFGLLCATALTVATPAQAQERGTIRLIVGFPPGGSTDLIARLIGDKLRPILGQTVVVENRPGIGGRLGAEALKNAAPDGLTYMVAPNATPVFQALFYPVSVLRYDHLTDHTPVAALASYPMALAVSTKTGTSTGREFINWVKANPKSGLFGTAGLGGHTHFSGVLLGKAAGVDLTVVPYKGNGPLVTDLLGGQVPAGVLTAGDIIQHERDGKVKVVGVFGSKRSPLMPNVPTLLEQGFDVDTGDGWTGMWAPAKTPKAELDRMAAAVRQVLALPEVRDIMMNKANLNPDFGDAAEVSRRVRKELDYWANVIKVTGFTPQQ